MAEQEQQGEQQPEQLERVPFLPDRSVVLRMSVQVEVVSTPGDSPFSKSMETRRNYAVDLPEAPAMVGAERLGAFLDRLDMCLHAFQAPVSPDELHEAPPMQVAPNLPA